MSAPRIHREDILDALSVLDVLDREGIELRRNGAEYRGRCPIHGGNNRTALSVRSDGQVWRCHSCGTGGSVIDLIAGIGGTSVSEAFKVAAELAGLGPGSQLDAEARQRRREARERQESHRRKAEAAARQRAVQRARRVWAQSATDHSRGVAYLESRGLGAAAGFCRYGARGEIRLPLYDGAGRLINVVSRWPGTPPGDWPKVAGLRGCTTAGMFGYPGRLAETEGAAVLVEGVTDLFAGLIRWPRRAVFGCHGAGRMPWVASALAPRLRERGLVLVADDDAAGRRAAARAREVAIAGGVPAELIRDYDLRGANDLAELVAREGGQS